MQPDRQIVRGHGGEERREARLVERMAGDVGEDLHALGAERLDGALRLGDGEIDVVQRHRRGEGREAVGMLGAQLRHCVVADPRQRLGPDSPSAMSSIGGLGSEMICR